MLAFVGRYGHQPLDVAMRLTVPDLELFAECVGELIKEESPKLPR